MGRSRRVLDRKALRADNEAAERREEEAEETEEEEEEDEDEDEEGEGEGDGEEEASGGGDDDDEGGGDEDDEDAPKKKKKKAPKPKAPAKTKPRSRAAKVVRMKVVWGVFNNSNQRVATYEYPKRKEADEHANRLTADKKSTHFVQPVKEPIEEKAEKAEK
jgi:hypothetical protein